MHIIGPWKCEECGKLSQFAEKRRGMNYIFCRNENCRYRRIVDMRFGRIVEADGTQWLYYDDGTKRRVRA